MIDVRHDSTSNRFRLGRIKLLKGLIAKTLCDKSSCSILDVGGTYNFWHVWRAQINWERTTVACVNLDPHHLEAGKNETSVQLLKGDACDLSTDISQIAFKSMVMLPKLRRRCNGFPSIAFR